MPGIGDLKAFVEAESPADYILAVVGIIPMMGDLIRKGVKGSDAAKFIDDLPEGFQVDNDGNFLDANGNKLEIEVVDGQPQLLAVDAPNREFDFAETGTGTHLRRTVDVDGNTVQINSGHGYNRSHSGGDVRDSGLSMSQIDNAIANDISRNVDVGSLPQVPRTSSNSINVNGYSLTYDVTRLPNGNVSVSTYYPGR